MISSIRNFTLATLGSLFIIGQFAISCKESSAFDNEITASLPDQVDFNFHIKPILADRCYKCHGPDEKARKAGLRLDQKQGLFGKTKKGNRIIAPGRPGSSELVNHIISSDPEFMMPPPESNLALDPKEKALIHKWIDQGAKWKDHWAFLPIEKSNPPKVKAKVEVRNPIDQFILARLEKEGIQPSPKADPERLLRRIYLDLTGLPPSIEIIDKFLKDTSDINLDAIIDQLLKSDAHAERMTMEWLDLARYADSHGYHADGWRSMYPWRDWVIKAFKNNMPFDQFGTVQLAGDLFPDATEEQILATGFNRNHQITAEGGVIDEEYRMEYVFDRINTTATAFLGLTLKCAQCHDHKFDPLTQKEFYQFGAFFNNVDEVGMNSDDGNCGPTLLLLPDSSKQQLAAIKKLIEKTGTDITANKEHIRSNPDFKKATFTPKDDKSTAIYLPLDKLVVQKKTASKKGNPKTLADGNPLTSVAGQVEIQEGKVGSAFCLDDEYEGIFIDSIGLFDRHQPFSAGVWIKPEIGKGFKTIFCNSGDKNTLWRGWDLLIDTTGELIFRLIHALPHDQLRIQSNEKINFQRWQHVMVTYDGSGRAEGMRIFLDGKLCNTRIEYNQLTRSVLPINGDFKPIHRPLRLGKWNETFGGEIAFLKGCFDDIRIYTRTLSSLEIAGLAESLDKSRLSDPEVQLEDNMLNKDETHRQLSSQLHQLVAQETVIASTAVEVQVMDEDRPRASYVLDRGIYSEKREQVNPGVPVSLKGMPEGFPQNRLGLAQWIFDKDNPLTARVTVNRYWQIFFGKGIVATAHDFGNQGALPSHPELLDWLANELIAHHWDIRWLVRTIIGSAAYRRSSDSRDDLKDIDPQNALLARGPSFRLSAEMIRDNALSGSGLLVAKVGGEPVKPYQRDNIWGEKNFFSARYMVYHQDTGDNLYRRSMYTVIKRTSPHPAMITFDGNDRSYCLVQRPTTNTPLQALVLLNDPTYMEAARVLAQKMIKSKESDLNSTINYSFRSFTGRHPTSAESKLLKELYEKEIIHFKASPESAKNLLSIGEYPVDSDLDPIASAALTIVNNTIINLDESYMRR